MQIGDSGKLNLWQGLMKACIQSEMSLFVLLKTAYKLGVIPVDLNDGARSERNGVCG